MNATLRLSKFSIGVGDRFGRQAAAQLKACALAAERGVTLVPVWNKSNREHLIIGSEPGATRAAADAAVRALAWPHPYHVDADHIRLDTVGRFIPHSDFFTIDVADSIGQNAPRERVAAFIQKHPELARELCIPGIERPIRLTQAELEAMAAKYLLAVAEAGRIYRHIRDVKGEATFITEVSMDETDLPQTPPELLVILAALADEQVPVQTIAPKFTGRFNKGVDYVGHLAQFEREFNDDLAVIAFATKHYPLPDNLKLSVHSGSDKFSIYAPMNRALSRTGAGLHLKTAGTTWLEELIGLAESGGDALALAKDIYRRALEHRGELCAPYASVIDIDPAQLPPADAVDRWTSDGFAGALCHEPANPCYNPHFRQLLHVGYKIAAQLGPRYLQTLDACAETVGSKVTHNLFARHIQPLLMFRMSS